MFKKTMLLVLFPINFILTMENEIEESFNEKTSNGCEIKRDREIIPYDLVIKIKKAKPEIKQIVKPNFPLAEFYKAYLHNGEVIDAKRYLQNHIEPGKIVCIRWVGRSWLKEEPYYFEILKFLAAENNLEIKTANTMQKHTSAPIPGKQIIDSDAGFLEEDIELAIQLSLGLKPVAKLSNKDNNNSPISYSNPTSPELVMDNFYSVTDNAETLSSQSLEELQKDPINTRFARYWDEDDNERATKNVLFGIACLQKYEKK